MTRTHAHAPERLDDTLRSRIRDNLDAFAFNQVGLSNADPRRGVDSFYDYFLRFCFHWVRLFPESAFNQFRDVV